MNAPFNLPQNQAPSNPELADALALLKKDILLNSNCHHLGTVQSFNPSAQTASATINYKKTFFKLNPITKVYDPVLIDYPQLIDCPVVCLGGGGPLGGALTFPVAQGDECLVLFNDRDMDNWFKGGGNGAVATPRLHSFADGIILVGVRSLGNVLSNYDSVRAVLRNGDALVGVGPLLVKIANTTYTLNTVLQNLITAIEGIVTTNCVVGSPVTLSPASIAALNVVAAQIAGLLE